MLRKRLHDWTSSFGTTGRSEDENIKKWPSCSLRRTMAVFHPHKWRQLFHGYYCNKLVFLALIFATFFYTRPLSLKIRILKATAIPPVSSMQFQVAGPPKHEPLWHKPVVLSTTTTITTTVTRNMFLFIVSRQDSYIRRRIEALQQSLGNRLLIVWDSKDGSTCPAWTDTTTDVVHCIDHSHQAVSESHRLSHEGKGQERAVMWAMAHRDQLDHVWFMEQDVEYTTVDLLVQMVNTTDDLSTDLLHQSPFLHPTKANWFWLDAFLNQTADFRPFGATTTTTDIKRSLLNLFRVSSVLLQKMEEFYERNHRSWVFFEALIPTLVHQHNLTSVLWTDYILGKKNISSFMRFRPCYTTMMEPGIYHPVKFKNLTYQECIWNEPR